MDNFLLNKIINAYKNGTLAKRALNSFSSKFFIPIEILCGYSRLKKDDRNINLTFGFTDHRKRDYHIQSSPENIRRIIAAYKKSKLHQKSALPEFKIRGLWNEWININYKKLKNALESENIEDLSIIFENIFRERCTIGTGGYDDFIRYNSFLGGIYIKYVWCKYRDNLLSLNVDPTKISFPKVGNPTGIMLNNSIISIQTLRHAYHAFEISELLRNINSPICVEIGSGLGGQAYQTIKFSKKNISKYILFDIPEVCSISSYFLLTSLPKKNIRLFGEGPISVSSQNNFDIGIFPHFSIDELPENSVNLFYNSCSFSEMDQECSKKYLSIIENACNKYFLHDNHDSFLHFINSDGSISKNVIGSNLIPNETKFKRIFKKPRVHGLPEDRNIKHYEYLYERI